MRISKPVRILAAAGAASAMSAAGVVVGFRLGSPPLAVGFGLILMLVGGAAGEYAVNCLDLWLRRTTRDPSWLMTDEGRRGSGTDDRRPSADRTKR